jgi:hypothetical protein
VLSLLTSKALHLPRTAQDVLSVVAALDVRRRYVPLKIGGLQNVDYRTKTFSCSKCGAAAYIAVIEPIKETGMHDYRLDEVEAPKRHPAAVDRLIGRRGRSRVDYSGGELPGRRSIPDASGRHAGACCDVGE